MPLAWIAGAAVGTALVGAYEGVKAGNQAADAAAYNAQVDANNQKIAEERAAINVMEQQHANRYTEGAQVAAYGGSGVAFSGSPLDVMAAKAISDNFKIQVAQFNGLVDASHDMAQGTIDSMMSSQYRTQGIASGLAGVSNAALTAVQVFGGP